MSEWLRYVPGWLALGFCAWALCLIASTIIRDHMGWDDE